MDKAQDFFSLFYTRFVLRDVMGKVIPGLVAILGTISAATNTSWTWNHLRDLKPFEVLFLIGLAWNTTLFLQSAGDATGVESFTANETESKDSFSLKAFWKRLFHKPASQNDKFIKEQKDLNEFQAIASEEEKAIYERTVVIKESAGNTGLAILLCSAALFVQYVGEAFANSSKQFHSLVFKLCLDQIPRQPYRLHVAVLGVVIFATLRRMREEHKNRQLMYVKLTIEQYWDARRQIGLGLSVRTK